MAGFEWNTAAGGLTIGGVDMMQPAWQVTNLHVLWLPANQRGTDRLIPGTAGRKAYQRYADATVRTLEMIITGEVDRLGATNADLFEGLQANVDYLIANVVNPPGSGDGTRSMVLTMPDATTRTEPVHVTGMDFGTLNQSGRWVRATIDVSIPSGQAT